MYKSVIFYTYPALTDAEFFCLETEKEKLW
jgi:hypothetical protein